MVSIVSVSNKNKNVVLVFYPKVKCSIAKSYNENLEVYTVFDMGTKKRSVNVWKTCNTCIHSELGMQYQVLATDIHPWGLAFQLLFLS